MGSFAESLLLCWRSEIHVYLLPISTNNNNNDNQQTKPCWRSQVNLCLIPRTATTNSNTKQQKAMGVKYTFVCFQHQQNRQKNNNNGQAKPCTFVSSRLNIFRLRHLDANVLFILARLKHDNKQFLREKTSNVFLPLLLGFQLTTFHMIRPTVKGTHEMWESIRKIVPAVSLERLSGLRCSKT